MTILIIGYMHKKYDKRVFRTVESLAKENKIIYQYWVKEYEKPYTEGNIEYIPIQYTKNLKINPLIKLNNRKKLDKKILDIIKNRDYDILYMHHYLTSAPVKPFKIAKNRNKKVIYDIHEYHPEQFMKDLSGFKKKIKDKIIWKIFEKQLKLSDKLIFVSEQIQQDIFRKLNLTKKYLIFKNYASMSITPKEKRKEICFVGATNRSLDDEKELIKKLIEKGFAFKIIGMDLKHFKDISHEYTSFLPYKKMMEELSKSAFSLVSFNTSKNRSYKNDIFSLPHKYYDSIATTTPIIVRNTLVSMAQETKDLGIGVVINPKNVNESVEKILKAYDNYDELIKNISKHKERFLYTSDKEKTFISFVTS